MQHRYIYITIGLCLIFSLHLQAQTQQQQRQNSAFNLVGKPVRSSLGETNIAVGANSFTGALNLDVPLYQAKFRDFTIPLSLAYTGGQGIKPDVIPGSYGNGWDLQCGGYITKVVNGFDVNIRAGDVFLPVVHPLEPADWASQPNMDNHYQRMNIFYSRNGSGDVYTFNFLGHSGTFFTDHLGNIKVQSNNGDSYSIVKGQDKTNIKTTIFPFEDQEFSGPGEYSVVYNRQNQSIAVFVEGFTIKDKKGITYTFGYNDNSIEFTRVAHKGLEVDPAINLGRSIIPRKWMLTKITFLNGEVINYTYNRGKLYTTFDIACRGKQYYSGSQSLIFPSGYGIQITGTLTNPVYLDRIVLPNQSTITFAWSTGADQLSFPLSVPNQPFNGQISLPPSWKSNVLDETQFAVYFGRYFDIGAAYTVNRFPDKLDRITISDAAGGKQRSVHLNYTNATNTRLKLTSVELYDKSESRVFSYGFYYNTTALPAYLSMQEDHQGYYNGKLNMPPTQPVDWQSSFNYYQNGAHAMYTSKEPDISFAKAEILERVILPNGGEVSFDYENHEYSKTVTHWPFLLTDNNANTEAAGLRLKATNYFVDGVLTNKKGYYYSRNGSFLPTALTSGICSYTPIYQNDYTGLLSNQDPNLGRAANTTYWTHMNVVYHAWDSKPMNPQSAMHGPAITYSVVTEREEGGGSGNNGYTRTTYTNYDVSLTDDDVADKPVDNPVLYHKIDNGAQTQLWKSALENDRGLERGLVATQEVFKSDGALLQKTRNYYNNDPARFNDHIRNAIVEPTEFFTTHTNYIWSVRYLASLHYTFYPYLKRTVVTQRDDHLNDMSTTTEFTYDQYRNVKTLNTTNSRNEVIEKIFEYPADKASTSTLYTAMKNAHMVDALLTERTKKNGNHLMETITEYINPSSNIFVPSQQTTQIGSGQPFVTSKYTGYDMKGNLLETETPGGFKQSILWGYNSLYPVAIASGVSYNNASSIVTPTLLQSPVSDDEIHNLLDNLRNQYPNAQIQSYGYDAMGNLKSGRDGAKRKVFYNYDAFGRLSLIRDQDRNVLKKFAYQYANSPLDPAIAAGLSGNPVAVYAKITVENIEFTMDGWYIGDLYVYFYRDAAGTLPYDAIDMSFEYHFNNPCSGMETPIPDPTPIQRTASGSRAFLQTQTVGLQASRNCHWEYYPPVPGEPGGWIEVCEAVFCLDTYYLLPPADNSYIPIF
jgi:YD repeat-containing protein